MVICMHFSILIKYLLHRGIQDYFRYYCMSIYYILAHGDSLQLKSLSVLLRTFLLPDASWQDRSGFLLSSSAAIKILTCIPRPASTERKARGRGGVRATAAELCLCP